MPIDPSSSTRDNMVDHLDMVFAETTTERVVITVDVTDHHLQPYGIVHGGLYCAMAETAASVGAAMTVMAEDPDGGAVGQSNHTDFLRATRGGRLTATATPVHVGRSVQLWQVDITDDADRLVAQSKVRMFNIAGTGG